MKIHTLAKISPSIVVVVAILLIWQIVVSITNTNPQLLPSPSLIYHALVQNIDVIAVHTFQTLKETLIGIIAGIILGVSVAILFDASYLARRAFLPLLITSQTIPMIALAPLLLLWLGFGILPKIIIVTLYCFFPIAIAMADGLRNIDKEFLNLFTSMNASYIQKLRLLKIPASLPSFFSGLKIAVTYSITGAMVGEYIGAFQGLGVFIQTSANAHAIPLVFATIFVTVVISLILFWLVCVVESAVIPWQNKKNI